MSEPTKRKKKDEDEVTLAKSILDEIINETESEDFGKEHKGFRQDNSKGESSGNPSNKGKAVCLGSTLVRNS